MGMFFLNLNENFSHGTIILPMEIKKRNSHGNLYLFLLAHFLGIIVQNES